MIEQTETNLSKGDKIQGKSKDTLSHSNPASEEVNNYHQEKMLDENELNDDHCFKCNKKGELYCCDRCFRAFHKACINTKKFSKFWNCEYCTQHNFCAQCQLPRCETLSDKSELICTICFRFVHRLCCQVPEQVLNSCNHFFIGSDNYVCTGCMRQFGYKFVLSFYSIQADPVKLYYFVNINTRSPIHCGWFDQTTLRQLPQKEQDKFKEVQVFQVPKIDKILRMKVPLHRKQQDYQQILNQLILKTNTSEIKQSRYGGSDNFCFLVVWEGNDYTAATWQDQKVLQYSAKQNFITQLLKYLLYKKLELTLKDKRPLYQLIQLINKYLPAPSRPPFFRHENLLNNFHQAKSSLNYVITGETYSQTIDFFSYYIQQFYAKDLTQQPILLLCGGPVARWQRRMQELCTQVNVVALKGSEAHIYELKQKQITFQLINGLKCHLIILPIERWPKEKKYLISKQFHFSHIIFDQLEFEEQKINNFSKKTYILDKTKKNWNKVSLQNRIKMSKEIQVQFQIVGYDLSANKMLTNFQPQHKKASISQQLADIFYEDRHPSERSTGWQELERSVFLQFVLAFGFNYPAEEMFVRLLLFAKGTLGGDENSRTQFKQYSKRFLAALNKMGNEEAIQHRSYYFFNIKPESVLKRILKLHLLKANVDGCKHTPQKFKQVGNFYIFQGVKSACVRNWQPKQDYILSALILEKGFGRWVQIVQSKDWVKWVSSCHLQHKTQPKRLTGCTFSEYVKKILLPECQQAGVILRNLEEILRERAQCILSAYNKP